MPIEVGIMMRFCISKQEKFMQATKAAEPVVTLKRSRRSEMRKVLLKNGVRSAHLSDGALQAKFDELKPDNVLAQFIPENRAPKKRNMIGCEPSAYDFISELAIELDTSRNKIVTALVEHYKASKL